MWLTWGRSAAAAAGLLAAASSIAAAGGALTVPAQPHQPRIAVLAGVPGERVEASIDGHRVARGLRYRDVTDAVRVKTGDHVVSLRVAADREEDQAVQVRVRLRSDEQATVVRYLDSSGQPRAGRF